MDESVVCPNCKYDISSRNADLHLLHCKRHMQLCGLCNEPVPRASFQDHLDSEHKEIACSKCNERFQQGEEDQHERFCQLVEVMCEYCQLMYARNVLVTHLESCGTRTDECPECKGRVMLCELAVHVCAAPAPRRPRPQKTRPKPARATYSTQGQFLGNNTPPDNGTDYLNELISTDHLASSIEMLPCEFCNAPVPLDDLILHETGCMKNDITPLPSHLAFFEEDVESYIPCEFCCKQFPLSVIIQHQAGCTPVRRNPPPHIVDDRPIRPQPPLPHPTTTIQDPSRRKYSRNQTSSSQNIDHVLPVQPRQSSIITRPVPHPKGKKKTAPVKVAGNVPEVKGSMGRSLRSNVSLNDLGKATVVGTGLPAVVIPKRKQTVPRAAEGASKTQDSAARSPKIINKNNRSVANDGARDQLQTNGNTASMSRDHQPANGNSLSDNLAGSSHNQKGLTGKNVNMQISATSRSRQNILGKYRRNKTFVVENDAD